MTKKTFRILFTVAPILYMILIWILSSLPTDAVIQTSFSFDHKFKESLHFIEFGILYLLFVGALLVNGKFSNRTNLVAAIIAILYGLLDEFHQSFMPYRSATLIDFIKDTTGVLVAYYIVRRKKMHNK